MFSFATLIVLSLNTFASTAPHDPSGRLNLPSVNLVDGIYELGQAATLTPDAFETLGEDASADQLIDVTIPARQPFAVHSEGDVTYVEPLVADEALGTTPDLFTFSRVKVAALSPKFLAFGDAVVMYERFLPEAETRLAGRCKYYVEKHLGFHVPGACASSMSAAKLARVGFHPTNCATAQMKIWGGGRHGCGHAAYRTHGGGWSSTDFVGDPGSNYYAKGCYSRHGKHTRRQLSAAVVR